MVSGIGALAGQEQRAEGAEVVAADVLALGVLLLDGAEGRGRGEHGGHLVLGDHAPEGARVRRADRLALVEDRRAAVQQRRIADVGVAHHPAHVGGGPEGLAGLDAVVVLHGPLERHHVPAVVAHHALGLARGAGRVEDVERVGGLDRDAAGLAAARAWHRRWRPPSRGRARDHRRLGHGPLQHEDGLRLVLGEVDGGVEQRLVVRRCGRARCRRRPRGSPPALASSMRVASSGAAKPPNTTEWMAPMRAQASMAITASGIIGM